MPLYFHSFFTLIIYFFTLFSFASIASEQRYTINEDTSLFIDISGELVTAGASQPIGMVNDVVRPKNGRLSLRNEYAFHTAELTYIPDKDYCGEDSFSLETSVPPEDIDAPISIPWQRTVKVTVVCMNELPRFGHNQLGNITMDQRTTRTVNFTLIDDDHAVSTIDVSAVSSSDINLIPLSRISFSGSGASRTMTIQPVAQYYGEATIRIRATDGGNGSTDKVFKVKVDYVPLPVPSSSSFSMNEDSTLEINVSNIDPTAMGAVENHIKPKHGTIRIQDPLSFTLADLFYTPKQNFCGTDSFSIRTYMPPVDADNLPYKAWEHDIEVEVKCINDPPVFSGFGLANLSMEQGTTKAINFSVADTDSGASAVRVSTVSSSNTALIPLSGIKLSGSGGSRTLEIVPSADGHGESTVTLRATDSSNASVYKSFKVTVNHVPGQIRKTRFVPIINENITIFVPYDGRPSQPGGFSNTASNGYYNISWQSVSGAQYYILEQLVDGVWQEVAGNITSSYYRVQQGSSERFRVSACNDYGCSQSADVIVYNMSESVSFSTQENTSVSIPWSSLGIPFSHAYSSINSVHNGSASILSNGIEFTPAHDFCGTSSFIVETHVNVDTPLAGIESVRVVVDVACVNSAPTIFWGNGITLKPNELQVYTVRVEDEDSPVSALQLTHDALSDSISFVQIHKEGNRFDLTIKADLLAVGSSSLVLTATDGDGGVENATIPITIDTSGESIEVDASLPSATLPDSEYDADLKGQAGVDGGAFTYQLPLHVAPGRNGMQPKLTLSYSSQSGIGNAGMGWSLSGTEGVARCSTNYSIDGYQKNVTYHNDKLCLNGSRLILTSGQYGEVGAIYQPERAPNILIEQFGGGVNSNSAYFVLTDSNGNEKRFGEVVNAREIHTGQAAPYQWLMNRTSDPFNNTIHYTYTELGDAQIGYQKVLSRIEYTGFGDTRGSRTVDFAWENPVGVAFLWGGKFATGAKLSSVTNSTPSKSQSYVLKYDQSQLQNIRLCDDALCTTELAKKSFDWVRAGVDEYVKGDDHPLVNLTNEYDLTLSSVPYSTSQDYDGDGIADLSYAFGGTSFIGTAKKSNDWVKSLPDYQSAIAVDGDRELPEVYWNIMNGAVMDYNRNGIPDFMYYNSQFIWQIAEYDPVTKTGKHLFDTGINGKCKTIYHLNILCYSHKADLNGDGYMDILSLSEEAGGVSIHLRNTRDGLPIDGFTNAGIITGLGNSSGVSFADINNDGVVDIYVSNESKWFELKHEQGTITVQKHDLALHHNVSRGYRSKRAIWLDYNGDGLLDIMAMNLDRDQNRLYWKMHYNQGGGSFSEGIDIGQDEFGLPSLTVQDEGSTYNQYVQTLDFNKDGRADLLVPNRVLSRYSCWDLASNQECIVAIEEASGVLPLLYAYDIWSWKILIAREDGAGFDEHQLPETIRGALTATGLADVNGDGHQDIVASEGYATKAKTLSCQPKGQFGQVHCYQGNNLGVHVYFAKAENQNLLKAVNGQSAVEASVSYTRLGLNANTSEGIYFTDNTPLDDPRLQRAGGSKTVVSQLSLDAGNGLTQSKNFTYANGIFHTQGRGFQGFETITETNTSRGLVTQTQFFTEFPYSGMVKSRQVKLASNDNLVSEFLAQEVKAQWCESNTTKTYSPRVTKSIEYHYDLTSQAVKETKKSTSSYTCFGRVKTKSVTLTDEAVTRIQQTKNDYIDGNVSGSYVLQSKASLSSVSYAADYSHDNSSSSAYSYTKYDDFVGNKARDRRVCGSETSVAHTDINALSCIIDKDVTKTVVLAFDSYGNTESQTTSQTGEDASVASLEHARTVTTQFETEGYFPQSQQNNLWGLSTNASTFAYDAMWGKVTSTSTIQGVHTNTALDLLGRPLRKTTSGIKNTKENKPQSEETVYYAYLGCPVGSSCVDGATHQVWQVQDGRPIHVVYTDSLGREVGTLSMPSINEQVITRTEYDVNGNLVYKSQPHFKGDTQVAYEALSGFDVLGRPAQKETYFGPQQYTVDYTYSGLKTDITVTPKRAITGGVGQFSVSRIYSQKQLLQTTDANGSSTHFTYHANSQPNYIRDAKGSILSASYNGLGHKIQVDDPNMGSWHFKYNVLNELREQKDAQNILTTLHYDALGRMVKRIADGSIATWQYDTTRVGLGFLDNDAQGGYVRSYNYEGLGRVEQETLSIDGHTFTKLYEHDEFGNLSETQYGTDAHIKHVYTPYGRHQGDIQLVNGIEKRLVEFDAFSATGNITQQSFSNGLIQRFNYHTNTSLMESVCTSKTGSCNIGNVQYQSYLYDGFGNLTYRDDIAGGRQEQFYYDQLHRLDKVDISVDTVTVQTDYEYDLVGNLTLKSDYASSYVYGDGQRSLGGNAGPNAIREVLLNSGEKATFTYDNNGNLTSSSDGDLSIKYTPGMKPHKIDRNGNTVQFAYDANNKRIKQVRSSAGKSVYYLSGYEIEVDQHNTKSFKVYVGNHTILSNEAKSPRVIHTHVERLGSIASMTSGEMLGAQHTEEAMTLQRRSYDSFGRAFDAYKNDKLASFLHTRRGFTGHEHLPDVGLIHMNGRGYDPLLGRFLSVDPVIQSPTNTQSVNPYSYIMNNPLAGTDPSGYTSQCEADGKRVCDAEKDEGVDSGGKKCLLTMCRLGRMSLRSGERNDNTSVQAHQLEASQDRQKIYVRSAGVDINISDKYTFGDMADSIGTVMEYAPDVLDKVFGFSEIEEALEDPSATSVIGAVAKLHIAGKLAGKLAGKAIDGVKSVINKAADNLPTTRAALHADLTEKGFKFKGVSRNQGYTTYKGPEGKIVTVKPTGEVIPVRKIWKPDGSGKFPQRQDYNFKPLRDQSHKTDHYVEPIVGPFKGNN
ncbi:hypothetical protein JF50_05100 [Pseudoalteromonas luteoviolacea]|uniref:Insecticide toxin TcdB middle/N-terminal domain-containing protein n=1 Tax=Pseudoalteromonas luteoviolacea TaxID=43657 RepID=A0A0C1QT15_9GAMM|nr:FG-GAP-like repeat-containing protein [Pseudoalteromonas luteoviolacea]KID58107.1 hypothetical protein JF50_05100 [Pseudoalteromonas luteoviolacea]